MNPNFFIVGVPKSGTTSIYNYLKSHQEVFMSKKKEINFFSNQEILSQNLYYNNSVCDSMENYLKHFINSENYKVVGEASVSYLFYQNVAEKIYKFNNEAKILIILRDPVMRAFSHYLMDYRLGYTKSGFSAIIRSNNSEKNQNLFFQQYVSVGMYYEQVKKYVDLFGKNVLILKYEDLIFNNNLFIKKICDFLDINYYNIKTLNKSNIYKNANTFIMYFYQITFFRKFANFCLSKFYKDKLSRLIFNYKKPKIHEEDFLFLRKYYYNDICLLEKEIDVDLSNWKNEK